MCWRPCPAFGIASDGSFHSKPVRKRRQTDEKVAIRRANDRFTWPVVRSSFTIDTLDRERESRDPAPAGTGVGSALYSPFQSIPSPEKEIKERERESCSSSNLYTCVAGWDWFLSCPTRYKRRTISLSLLTLHLTFLLVHIATYNNSDDYSVVCLSFFFLARPYNWISFVPIFRPTCPDESDRRPLLSWYIEVLSSEL